MAKTSVILILLASCCFVGAYLASKRSIEFEFEKERNEIKLAEEEGGSFGFYHGESPEFNNWDLAQVGLLVIGASLGLSAAWLRKK